MGHRIWLLWVRFSLDCRDLPLVSKEVYSMQETHRRQAPWFVVQWLPLYSLKLIYLNKHSQFAKHLDRNLNGSSLPPSGGHGIGIGIDPFYIWINYRCTLFKVTLSQPPWSYKLDWAISVFLLARERTTASISPHQLIEERCAVIGKCQLWWLQAVSIEWLLPQGYLRDAPSWSEAHPDLVLWLALGTCMAFGFPSSF